MCDVVSLLIAWSYACLFALHLIHLVMLSQPVRLAVQLGTDDPNTALLILLRTALKRSLRFAVLINLCVSLCATL